MLLTGRKVDPLTGGGGEEQSLGRIIGKEWPRGRIVGRRGGELSLKGRTRIRKEIAFHNQGLFEGVKMIR